jgi:DNA-binding transcriptional MerR regulator
VTATRIRIAELSARTSVSVDTIRFYQKRRLLDPPVRDGRIAWYDDSHLMRLREIRSLQDQGLPLAVIGTLDAVAESSSPLRRALANARTATPERRISIAEAAARAGLSVTAVQAAIDAGLIDARAGSDGGTIHESDVVALEAGAELLEAGIPIGSLIELAVTFDSAAREVADRAADLFDTHVRSTAAALSGDEEQSSELLASRFERLLDVTERLVATHIRRALLDAAESKASQ